MEELETYALDNDELVVNVTEYTEISEVTKQLAEHWTWDSTLIQHVPADEEEGEPASEWLVLVNARKKAPVLTAA